MLSLTLNFNGISLTEIGDQMSWPANLEFCIVDFETTGLFPQLVDKIVEYAFMVVKNGEITDRGEGLINPLRPMNPKATRANGITDEMLHGKKRFTEIGNTLWHAINNRVFIAHNANFDLKFLAHECKNAGWEQPDFRAVDSLEIARKYWKDCPNHQLGTLAGLAGHIWTGNSHRAMADVEALFTVMDYLFINFPELSYSPDNLFKYGEIKKISVDDEITNNHSEMGQQLLQHKGEKIEINYQSNSSGKSNRYITPLDIFFSGKNEFLDAFCHNNNEKRTFRINRISSIVSGDNSILEPIETFVLEQLRALEKEDNPEMRRLSILDLYHYSDETIDPRHGVDSLSPFVKGEIISELSKYLNDENHEIRIAAAFSLGYFSSKETEENLIICLLKDDVRVKPTIIQSLSGCTSSDFTEILIDYLKDDNSSLKVSSITGLERIGTTDACEDLILCLKDENSEVRLSAIRALSTCGDSSAVEPLIRCLKDFPTQAADSLSKIGDERAVIPIIELLHEDNIVSLDNNQLAFIAHDLGRLRNKQAILPLSNLLENEDDWVVSCAMSAMKEILSNYEYMDL